MPIFWVFWAGLLLSLFAGAAAMRARYKAGDEVLRRQVLWLAYGALLIPVWLGGTSLLGVIGFSSEASDAVTLTLLQAWPAVAVAVAITRHGLYSIDRLVNRTLVYAVLTALLVATYALASLLAGLVIGGSKVTASLATIAAALLFLPLRDRLQTAVDRRFARKRFDAVRMVRRLPGRGARRAGGARGRRRGARPRARRPERDAAVPASGDARATPIGSAA